MSPPFVRDAAVEDAADIADLSRVLGYPATRAEIEERFSSLDPADGVFVAELDGRVVGFVHVFARRLVVSAAFAELGGLVVEPAERHRGIGRALLERTAAWATDHGLRKLRIRAGSERAEAHAFYPAAGCRFVKEQGVYERPT